MEQQEDVNTTAAVARSHEITLRLFIYGSFVLLPTAFDDYKGHGPRSYRQQENDSNGKYGAACWFCRGAGEI